MVMFILSVFDWKYPFWANLVKKIKILTLSWNLVRTLIRTCRIQWWCSVFLLLIGNTLFGVNLVEKVKIVSWSWNLVARLTWICWIQWCGSLLSFWWKCTSWENLVQIANIYSFFCFWSEMLFFGKIWSKMSKLSV